MNICSVIFEIGCVYSINVIYEMQHFNANLGGRDNFTDLRGQRLTFQRILDIILPRLNEREVG